jgi:predicted enzyme related to lactoylglutathione lyase
MKTRHLDHIDLRVKDFKKAIKFYRKLLPALGFTHDTSDDEWGTFYAVGKNKPSEFFGFTADPNHVPNGTRIAFWAETREEVDRVAKIAEKAGAKNLDGPELVPGYRPGYYALFFDDPEGNQLEICCRERPIVKK